jgi:hypothetical protein
VKGSASAPAERRTSSKPQDAVAAKEASRFLLFAEQCRGLICLGFGFLIFL